MEPTEPFVLPAQCKDIYFNFVVPIPVVQTRYVSGVELLPGNRAVHHAFIAIDPTRTSRRKGAISHPAGFVGMDFPETASMPDGQLLRFIFIQSQLLTRVRIGRLDAVKIDVRSFESAQ